MVYVIILHKIMRKILILIYNLGNLYAATYIYMSLILPMNSVCHDPLNSAEAGLVLRIARFESRRGHRRS